MSIGKLANVLKMISGSELSDQEYQNLKKEALLMTLARGTRQDTQIHPLEVATVKRKIEELTGESISDADIRVAAHAELYEQVPFKTCLSRLAAKLTSKDRTSIVHGLAEVLKSDERVADAEAAFFNEIATALQVTPAEIAGLGH